MSNLDWEAVDELDGRSVTLGDALASAFRLGAEADERRGQFVASGFGDYRDYLASHHWRITRRRALDRARGICQACHSEGRRLEVHHLTYARIGCEHDADLIAVCRACHAREHGLADALHPQPMTVE